MAGNLTSFLKSMLPKQKPVVGGLGRDNGFNPSATTSNLAIPNYRDHLSDIFADRGADSSTTLLPILFRNDPDVSAAVNAYLTLADTEPYWIVRDAAGAISRPGHVALEQLLLKLFTRFDYTTRNFEYRRSLNALCEQMRYMILLRGGTMAELAVDKQAWPDVLRQLDLSTIVWQEPTIGNPIPFQIPKAGGSQFSLDIPTIFVAFHRQDPTNIYAYSPFISAINTIASRQQIINDLYRIMQLTGYPRIKATLLEESFRKNAPADCAQDEAKMRAYLLARQTEIAQVLTNLRPDQAFIAFDSVDVGMMNDKAAAMELDITPIIAVLNAQNQAALKVMSTIIGRGESGVNTASVEARIFAMNADQLNNPISDVMSQALTLGIRLMGVDAIVEFGFAPAELRSSLELESSMQIRQARYERFLSLGVIDDDTFHLEMFNKIRPDAIPVLSGTDFPVIGISSPTTAAGDPAGTQPNPVTRSTTDPGANKASKSKSGSAN